MALYPGWGAGSPDPLLGRGAGPFQIFSGEAFIPGVQPSQSFFFVFAFILFSDKKSIKWVICAPRRKMQFAH